MQWKNGLAKSVRAPGLRLLDGVQQAGKLPWRLDGCT